jgi:hypothetical protein
MRSRRSITGMIMMAAMLLPAVSVHGQEADVPLAEWRPLAATLVAPTVAPDAGGEAGEEWSPERRAVAGAASYLLPGAGQFYRGDRVKGAVMLGAFAAAITFAAVAGIGEGEVCAGSACHTAHRLNSRFWLGLGTAAGVHAWSVVDALGQRVR